MKKMNQNTPSDYFSYFQNLDGFWRLSIDSNNCGLQDEWFNPRSPPQEYKEVQVPCIIQQYFPGYHGVVWYWRAFSCQLKSYLQGRYLLRFGMVDFAATVWINGQLIGKNEGPENPFEFDITDALDYENENWIVVRGTQSN